MKKMWMLGVIFLLVRMESPAQNTSLLGEWEGVFMDQFKITLVFESSPPNYLQGRVRLFQNGNRIQDDPLTDIDLRTDSLYFFIPDKETRFVGVADFREKLISGVFLFPDGSLHPLMVKKAVPRGIIFGEGPLDKEALREDLAFLFKVIREEHPAPYQYLDQPGWEGLWQRLEGATEEVANTREFFALASQLTDALGCSHTGLRMPDKWYAKEESREVYFPLSPVWVNTQLIVSGSIDNAAGIPVGSELLFINGRSVGEIIRQLLLFIPAEGWNRTTKTALLNEYWVDYYLLLDPSVTFEVKYRESSAHPVKKVVLRGIGKEEVERMRSELLPKVEKTGSFHFHLNREEDFGSLMVPSFAISDLDAYLREMEAIFLQLKQEKTERLIIDLRGNTGGHPIFGAILFSYLATEPFTWFDESYGVSPELTPLYRQMEPAANRFEGMVYLLVDGRCLSTTGHLIAHFQFQKRGQTMGEMPGSYAACNDGSVEKVLPYSGIQLNLPRQTFAVPGWEAPRYQLPRLDEEVALSKKAILEHRDPVMQLLLSRLSGGMN